jgi:hypothetical protein
LIGTKGLTKTMRFSASFGFSRKIGPRPSALEVRRLGDRNAVTRCHLGEAELAWFRQRRGTAAPRGDRVRKEGVRHGAPQARNPNLARIVGPHGDSGDSRSRRPIVAARRLEAISGVKGMFMRIFSHGPMGLVHRLHSTRSSNPWPCQDDRRGSGRGEDVSPRLR